MYLRKRICLHVYMHIYTYVCHDDISNKLECRLPHGTNKPIFLNKYTVRLKINKEIKG